jgi:tetratricopeptide (TPR) repeat protein
MYLNKFGVVILEVISLQLLFFPSVCNPQTTIKEYLEKGDKYFQAGEYQHAIDVYKDALKINPYHKKIHIRLGKSYLELNLLSEAEKHLKKALKLDPEYIPALNKLGKVYEKQKKYTKAKVCYKKVLKIDPHDPEAHCNLAELFQFQKKFKKTLFHYQQAIKANPEYVKALINLGKIYWEIYHDFIQASLCYKKVKAIKPESKLARFYLAELYMEKGWIEAAEKEYKEIIRLSPRCLEAIYKLINLYIREGDNKKIDIFCRKLVDINISDKNFSEYMSTIERLVVALIDKKKYKQMAELCKRIIDITPSDAFLKLYLSTIDKLIILCFEHRMFRLAIPLCERILSLIPPSKIVYYNLFIAYRGANEYKKAIDTLLKACELDAFDEVCWFSLEEGILGYYWQRVGTPLRNRCSRWHFKLAKYYLNTGNTFLAEYEYQRAKRLNPQNPNIRLELAEFYRMQGDLTRSVEELKKAVELEPDNVKAKDKIEEIYWQQETWSLVKEEDIDVDMLPGLKRRKIAVVFTTEKFEHYDIDNVAEKIIEMLLANSFTVSTVDVNVIQQKKLVYKPDNLKSVVDIAKDTHAEYLLWGRLEEKGKRISIESELFLLRGDKVKKLHEFLHVARNKYRLTRCLAYLAQELSEYFQVMGEVVKVDDIKVIINLGEKHGVKPQFICEVLDIDGNKIGEIEITEVDYVVSKGLITTATGAKQITPYTTVCLKKEQKIEKKKKKKRRK